MRHKRAILGTVICAAVLVFSAHAEPPQPTVRLTPDSPDAETDLVGLVSGLTTADDPFECLWQVNGRPVKRSQVAPVLSLACESAAELTGAGAEATEHTFTSGRHGRGIELNAPLRLSAGRRFQPARGSVAFWFKPSWRGDDGIQHTLFVAGAANAARLSIHKEPAPYQGLVFYIYEPDGRAHGVWTSGKSLKPDTWYHLMCYWELQAAGDASCRMGMYLNGVLVDSSPSDPAPIPPMPAPQQIVFGADADGQNPAHCVFDDILVSALPPADLLPRLHVDDLGVTAHTLLWARHFRADDRVELLLRRAGQTVARAHTTIEEATGVRDRYGGWREITGRKTGFFHAQKIKGRWWLITPAGNAFYALGTDHCRYGGHWCEKLGYAPYGRKNEAKYGSEAVWAEQTIERLKDWNFNLLSAGHSQSLRYNGLAHTEFLSFGAGFAGQDGLVEKTTWTGFPNVFNPAFADYCDQRAAAVCAPSADDPWLLGYFIDNELEWYGKTHRESGIFVEAWKHPADYSGKQALVSFLQSRHNTIGSFNRLWGTDFVNWEALSRSTEPPSRLDERTEPDWRGFLRLVAEEYFRISAEAIRRHDPNHMVIGCRFAGRAPGIWDLAGKYCDVVTLNYYGRVDLENRIAIGVEENFTQWHKQARKPLMITEWSFPALDSGLPCEHGAGERFDTQEQRAQAFDIYQRTFFRLPFMVGSDFFMWVDEPALGISSTFPEDSNYGLVNEDDEPYETLVSTCKALQALVYPLHAGRVAELSVRVEARDGEAQATVRNRGRAEAAADLSFRIDGRETRRRLQIGAGESARVREWRPELARPGAHLIVAEIDPEGKVAETDRTDNRAWATVYDPPTDELVGPRRLVTIANPSDLTPSPTAPVALPLRSLFSSQELAQMDQLVAGDLPAGKGSLHCRLDDLDEDGRPSAGDELAVSAELTPQSAVGFAVAQKGPWPVVEQEAAFDVEEDDLAFSADNGLLTISRGEEGGNLLDEVKLGDTPLGLLRPLVNQQAGGNEWWTDTTEVESVRVLNGPVRCVIDIVAARDAAPEGAGATEGPFDYRCAYRISLAPNSPIIESKLLWVENTDSRPWHMEQYFHYAQPHIGGSAEGDEPALRVPNYHLPVGVWGDEEVGAYYGCFAPEDQRCAVTFFTTEGPEGLNYHADARRQVSVDLEPGQRYDRPQPAFRLFAVRKSDQPGAPWADIAQRLRALERLIISVR
ncbi:MAG: LamG-like jellyroll fold domain-containing protein [Armatimonadota bacterium]